MNNPRKFSAEQLMAAATTADQRIAVCAVIEEASKAVDARKGPVNTERDAEIKALYYATCGYGGTETSASIAKRYGITGPRVRDIVTKNETPFEMRVRMYMRRKKDANTHYCPSCGADAADDYDMVHCQECISEGRG